MSIYKPGRKEAGSDYCKVCKSEEHGGYPALYDTTEDDGRFITVCQVCGSIQDDYTKNGKPKRNKRKP